MSNKSIGTAILAVAVTIFIYGLGIFVVNIGNEKPKRQYVNYGGGVVLPDDFTGALTANMRNRERGALRGEAVRIMAFGGVDILVGGLMRRDRKARSS
ncbi:MAG: hypothetical protein RKU31_01790 [Deltaproteobacteria bacterium]|jgi:hypothetical protein